MGTNLYSVGLVVLKRKLRESGNTLHRGYAARLESRVWRGLRSRYNLRSHSLQRIVVL